MKQAQSEILVDYQFGDKTRSPYGLANTGHHHEAHEAKNPSAPNCLEAPVKLGS